MSKRSKAIEEIQACEIIIKEMNKAGARTLGELFYIHQDEVRWENHRYQAAKAAKNLEVAK